MEENTLTGDRGESKAAFSQWKKKGWVNGVQQDRAGARGEVHTHREGLMITGHL